MKNCPSCKLMIRGRRSRCPLCQNALEGEGTPSPFPIIDTPRSRTFFVRLLVFATIASAIICVIINLALPSTGFWSIFVVAGVACMWLSLSIALRKRRDLLKNIAWQAIVISTLAIVWDVGTHWRAWSVNFVVPSIFIITMLLTPLLAKLLKMPRHSFIAYFALVFAFGLIPSAFLVFRLVTVPLPSLLSVGLSGVSLLALAVFGGRVIVDELRRRFHV